MPRRFNIQDWTRHPHHQERISGMPRLQAGIRAQPYPKGGDMKHLFFMGVLEL